MSNAEKYPEAWKIFVECARKWSSDNQNKHKFIYGIPNPENKNAYLYSECPAKLFNIFRNSSYKPPEQKIKEFRNFLTLLEYQEGEKI